MRKVSIWIIGILLLIVFLWVFFYFMLSPKPVSYYPRSFDKDKLITNQTFINMIVNDLKSPLGNNLTKWVIDEDDPNLMDEPWEYAYYVCRDDEHQGWIYYYGGESSIKSNLYGPYEWCYI